MYFKILPITGNESFEARSNKEKVTLFHKDVTSLQVKSSLYHEYFVTQESTEKWTWVL